MPSGGAAQAFVLEAVKTFFLLLVALRSGLPWAVLAALTVRVLSPGEPTESRPGPARVFQPEGGPP